MGNVKRDNDMKHYNSQLDNEHDATLRFYPHKNNLNWKEYLPFGLLGMIILALLISGILN